MEVVSIMFKWVTQVQSMRTKPQTPSQLVSKLLQRHQQFTHRRIMHISLFTPEKTRKNCLTEEAMYKESHSFK